MKYAFYVICAAGLFAIGADQVVGHGTSINAYVQSATNQIAVFSGYEPGLLESIGLSDILSDTPGIGISSTVNGFTSGDQLFLNVMQPLLIWEESGLATTPHTVIVDWPDGGGTSDVEYYEVTSQSTYQTGMTWGTYLPFDGTGGWEAHGEFVLDAANPAVGIYGLVVQLVSPGYVSSEPFLVPLIYDPQSTIGAIKIAKGIDALEEAILDLPAADFNRDTLVDQRDLSVFEAGFGAIEEAHQVQGDATLNGTVSGDDFLAWQLQFSGTLASFNTLEVYRVPEPATFFLAALFGMVSFALRRPYEE